MIRLRLAVLPFVLALAVPAVAQESPDGAGRTATEDRAAAAREFQEGQRAYAAGDYRLAAEQFEAAYKHKPHYASLWNAARARQRAGDSVRAANLYTRYLREAPPNTRDRNTAQSALRELAPKLGRLQVTAVGLDDVRLDGEALADRLVYVNPGAHVVEAVKKGEGENKDRSVRASPSVQAGQTVSVALVPPTADDPQPAASVGTPFAAPSQPPETEKEKRPGLSPIFVAVGAALTVVEAALTTASGLDTLNQRTQFDNNPSQSNLDSGKSKQLRTNILLGITAATAVLTGACAIWLVDWRGADHSAQVGVGLGELRVRATF